MRITVISSFVLVIQFTLMHKRTKCVSVKFQAYNVCFECNGVLNVTYVILQQNHYCYMQQIFNNVFFRRYICVKLVLYSIIIVIVKIFYHCKKICQFILKKHMQVNYLWNEVIKNNHYCTFKNFQSCVLKTCKASETAIV